MQNAKERAATAEPNSTPYNKQLPILECKKPFVEKEDFLFRKRPIAKISFGFNVLSEFKQ
ncbi:MAG: hypothetical protein A3I66_12360 [Burkholderiales bacterium RIFCSPLOWO2_02_FULL_57_36]|nr:MAG: hypothetical protein A3I66_12360 [Burkholderiales bacterium RIFCSPLOWO2_02_FULL_57_36]